MNLTSQKNNTIFRISILAGGLVFDYFKYSFLIFSVLTAFTLMMFVGININENAPFQFLWLFSSVGNTAANGTVSFNSGSIMKIFYYLSFGFFIVWEFAYYILKKVFNFNIVFGYKQKLKFNFIFVAALFLVSFLMIVLDDRLDNELIWVFGAFFLVNFFAFLGYLFFDFVGDKLRSVLD